MTTKHTPGRSVGAACMDYLMEHKSLSCWRAEDVDALNKIIAEKTAAPELLAALREILPIARLYMRKENGFGPDEFCADPSGNHGPKYERAFEAIAQALGQ